nr:MAG: putative capsid protein [XiangYun permutotetra-like virus]
MTNNKSMNKKAQKPKQRSQQSQPRQSSQKQKRKPVNLLLGVPVTGREVASIIKAPAKGTSVVYTKPFNIASASELLKKYATIYESYKIKSVAYRYIPDESGFSSGNVSIGIDYGKQPTSNLTREQISKLNPHYSGPIRKSTPWISISSKFVNTDLVRYTSDDSLLSTPFTFCGVFSCESKEAERTLGSIELQYTLEFQGILP